MRGVLVFLGILHDPDGPPKNTRRYWLTVLLPLLVVTLVVLAVAQLGV